MIISLFIQFFTIGLKHDKFLTDFMGFIHIIMDNNHMKSVKISEKGHILTTYILQNKYSKLY